MDILFALAILGIFYGSWIGYHLWWVNRPEKPINSPLDTVRVKVDSSGKVENWQFGLDGEIARCEVCHWPLASSADEGCVAGNCSYRPRPIGGHQRSGERIK